MKKIKLSLNSIVNSRPLAFIEEVALNKGTRNQILTKLKGMKPYKFVVSKFKKK